jgi:hypothetical protein
METQTNEPTITNWIDEEVNSTQTQQTGERLPSLKLEAGKITSFTVDFTNPFNKWTSSDGVVKALMTVIHKEENKILWMNVKNPLYHELLLKGKTGQKDFKISTTGTAKETRYTIVEED